MAKGMLKSHRLRALLAMGEICILSMNLNMIQQAEFKYVQPDAL